MTWLWNLSDHHVMVLLVSLQEWRRDLHGEHAQIEAYKLVQALVQLQATGFCCDAQDGVRQSIIWSSIVSHMFQQFPQLSLHNLLAVQVIVLVRKAAVYEEKKNGPRSAGGVWKSRSACGDGG